MGRKGTKEDREARIAELKAATAVEVAKREAFRAARRELLAICVEMGIGFSS